jgi:hypothetical protein
MKKGWIKAALLGLGLMANPAAAQGPLLPGQANPEPMADPLPCTSGASGNMPAHGMDQSCPNSLPANLPNAFGWPPCPEPGACYIGFGYMAQQRQRLGHGAAVVLDPSGGVHTGTPPPPGAPLLGDFNDVNIRFNNGERVTLGYQCDGQAFEISGFYLSQNSSTKQYGVPASLSTFFNVNGNFTNFPLGFEGDNGMWSHADLMQLRLQTAQGSAEANYRCGTGTDSDCSWLIGVRYFDLYERFGFYTGDNDLTVPNPTTESTYLVTTHNRIVAPQLGFEWNRPICCWLAFNMTAKGAWGANFLTVDVNLKRGDGFQGPHGGRTQTVFSQLYETGFFLDFRVLNCGRLRAGYDLMWAVDVAEALGQFDYNLANTSGRTMNHQSIFYQGPVVELSFLF